MDPVEEVAEVVQVEVVAVAVQCAVALLMVVEIWEAVQVTLFSKSVYISVNEVDLNFIVLQLN